MKIIKKQKSISALAVAAIMLSAGSYYVINTQFNTAHNVYAYTSAVNTVDPANAPDDYVITFPDVNLKRALNPVIARAMNADRKQKGLPQDVVRADDQDITAGDMKFPANMYGPLGLNGKNISNAEGLQFLVNATRLDIVGNKISDFAPLRDLPKLEELNMGANPATDLTPIAAIPKLAKLTLDRSPNLVSVAPLANAPALKVLHLPITKVADLAPLAQIPTLEELYINNMTTRPKINLAPLATAPKLKLINANTNRLTGADFAVLKNMPALETLMAAGNNVLNLNDMLKDGFTPLQRWSTFSDQLHTINTDTNPVFENPVRGVSGEIIPVNETDNIKNADPDGTLNPNGTHIKIVDLYGRGRVEVRWEKNFSKGQVTDRPFSGTITVTYNLPQKDAVNPTITPASPAKIVARKGTAINLNDVTAADNPGGSGLKGLTNNVAAQGLNPANPAKGKYTITYTAEDNAGNRATATREVEITDADALQAKVATVNDALLEGRTADSAQAVRDKKAAAEAIIAKNDATQDQIDQALIELNDAIDALETDKTPLTTALEVLSHRPEYVKTNAAVAAAEAKVRALNNEAKPDPSAVTQEAIALLEAMRQAAQDELVSRITAAEQPAATDGMEREGVEELQRVLAEVKQVRDSVHTNDPAKQQDVEKAVDDLEKAVKALKVDTRKLQAAAGKYNAEPEHIQQDPAVQAALAEANRVLNDPGKTPASVDKAARDLIKALEDAKQAEADRQTQANEALARAEQYKTPDHIADAKAKVAAIKNPTKKAELQPRVEALETDYAAKKNELQQLIARAQDPATTDGASQATKDAVTIALQTAQNIDGQTNAPQAELEKAIADLKEKVAALRPDKSALQAAINAVPSESAFVQNDANVRAKLQAANDVNGRDDATAEQIKQAKDELEKAIADARAVEAEQQAEQQRQTEAAAAVDAARDKANRSPVYFTTAQERIDAVKDAGRKAELQRELDALKAEHAKALQTLRDLIAKAKDPAATQGMTDATKQILQQAIATAEDPANQGDLDQATYEALTKDLQDALDGLLADKTPLATAEDLHNAQPDYIKNNPAVQSAFRRAQGTRAMPKPPVQDVRDHAKALEDAINAAIQAEEAAQNTAADALTAANDKLNAQLAPNELPAIDFTALEQDIAKVQDPAERTALEQALQDLRTAYAARKKQVDDYNAANPATPLPPVNNQGNTNQNNNANQPAKPADVQAPNTGHQRDTSAGLIAALGGTVAAAAGAAIVALRRKK